MNDEVYDVAIVGGGCAGLSALNNLSDYRTILLESSAKLGGRVDSVDLGSFTAELGAIYPITGVQNKNSDARDSEIHSKPILFILSDDEVLEKNSPIEAFEALASKDEAISSKLFYSQNLVANEKLNLAIKNRFYGDLSIISEKQKQLVQMLHQITNPGDIKDFPSKLRSLCLGNLPSLSKQLSNEKNLVKLYPIPTKANVLLNSHVSFIEETESYVNITYRSEAGYLSLKSRSVILTPPPALCLGLVKLIREDSRRFYNSTPYLSGWSFVFCFTGKSPDYSLINSNIHIWSACFITIIDEDNYIANCYVPSSRIVDSELVPKASSIADSIQSYLPDDSTLIVTKHKFWRHLAPNITNTTLENYSPYHYRLSNRVFYGGELSTYKPSSPYSYGLYNATNAGIISSKRVINNILSNDSGSKETSLPPLLNAYIYKFDQKRPFYIGSQKEGNVAFYGILLSASFSPEITSYLTEKSKDGLWEYHDGFGVTLEDSLIVLEGLIDSGLDHKKIQYHLERCIEKFYDENTGLFVTLANGRDSYWDGPSIHGTVQISYLILKYYNNPNSIICIEKILAYIKAEFTNDFVWKSRWFTNYHFTSFYVIRLLSHLQMDDQIVELIDRFYQHIFQTQLSGGSWDDSVISTSSIIMALTKLPKLGNSYSQSELKTIIRNASKFLVDYKEKQVFTTEPMLYYWYDTTISENQFTKKFYHCIDSGKIASALSTIALNSADQCLNSEK